MRTFRWLPGVVLAAGLIAGCSTTSSPAKVSSAAPPVKICGQTLSSTPSGVVVLSYVKPGTFQVPKSFNVAGNKVVLRFSNGCVSGIKVTTSAGFKIEASAHSYQVAPQAYSTVAVLVTRLNSSSNVFTVVRPSGSTTRIVF